MRDQKNRRALLLQKLQRPVANAVAQPVVEAGKGLVHQHHPRPRRQRPRQRDPLLLAPRQLVRMLRAKAGKVHLFKQFPDAPQLFRPVRPQPEAHVFGHRQMREQREILEHQPDRPRLGRDMHPRPRDQPAVDPDLARLGPLHPRDHPQRGRLAAARRPQKTGHLPRRNRQRHILDHRPPAKGTGQVTHVKPGGNRFGHAILGIRSGIL